MDTLNITSLLAGLSPQMMTSMTAGQQNGAQTPVDGSFMELLQGLVAQLGNPAEPMANVATPAQAPPWLDTLISLLGQNGSLPAQTPDPDGEASPTATTAQLTSMTDVMAAIQSILPETSLGQLADADALSTQPQIHPGNQDDGADQQTPLEATLAAMLGIIPAELASAQQSTAQADSTSAQQSAQTTATAQGTIVPVQTNSAASVQPATVAQSAEGQAADVQTIQPQSVAPAANGTTPEAAIAAQVAADTARPAETTAPTADFSTALNTAQANQSASDGTTTAPTTATTAQPAEGQATLNLRPEGQSAANGNAPASTAAAETAQAATVRPMAQSDAQSQQHDTPANGDTAMPAAAMAPAEQNAQPVFTVNDAPAGRCQIGIAQHSGLAPTDRFNQTAQRKRPNIGATETASRIAGASIGTIARQRWASSRSPAGRNVAGASAHSKPPAATEVCLLNARSGRRCAQR